MLSLAKKKFDNILTNAKAGTPYPKYLRASDVNLTSSSEKDPYPNKELTISSEAKINPRLAGIDNNKESSKDLLWIFDNFFMSFSSELPDKYLLELRCISADATFNNFNWTRIGKRRNLLSNKEFCIW